MLNIWFYLLVGLVQGILEWLPVSSEGNIVFIALWFDIGANQAISLAFWLHIGTMLAVLLVYRKEWKEIINFKQPDPNKYRSLIIYSTLGTALVGVPIKLFLFDKIDFEYVTIVIVIIIGVSLIITGLLLVYSRKDHSENTKTLSELTWREQLLLGLAQGFTIIPGVSRSGTTVSALLFMKTETENAFKGSFIISVPAVIGAVTLDILSAIIGGESLLEGLDILGILLAVITAFVFGVLTINALISVARKFNFASIAITIGILMLLSLFLLV